MDKEGRLNEQVPKNYQGLDKFKAREKILEYLEKKGLLEKKEKYEYSVPFVEDLIGSRFKINNPKATSSCGCGTSFSL